MVTVLATGSAPRTRSWLWRNATDTAMAACSDDTGLGQITISG